MIQDSILVCSPDPRIPHTAPNAPVRPTILEHTALLILAIPPESVPMLGESIHSTHTRISQSSNDCLNANSNGSKALVHSQAQAQKDLLDDELDNAKIQAIDESVTFLTEYVCDSEDPEVIICNVNMINEQWT
jgi:hypothetical protein